VTEFALILGIQVAALAYALVMGRGVAAHGGGPQRARRLSNALERATTALVLRQARLLVPVAAAVALAFAVLHFTLAPVTGLSRPGAAGTAGAGLLLGAALTWVGARFAVRLGVGSTLRATLSASRSLDSALSAAARAGGAVSLGMEALSGLGLVLVFGTAFALAGGTVQSARDALTLAHDVARLLPCFPLGAALGTLIVQRSGATYQTAADIGGDVSAEQKFGLARDDPRNPTLIGELAGDQLGEGATRAALVFLTAATSHSALLAIGLYAASLADAPQIALVLLPFVVRAFFLLGSGFGVAVVRVEEMKSPSGGLFRGYLTTVAIGLAGVWGASFWLAREQVPLFALAGLVGAVTPVAVAIPVWMRLLRATAGLRDTAESLRIGGGTAALMGLGTALEAIVLPVLGIGLCTVLAFQLGASSALHSGGIWTSLVAWAALAGAAPFAAAVSAVGTLAEGAPSVATLSGADSEAQRRTARLDEAQPFAASARSQLILTVGAAAQLSALAIPALARKPLRMEIGLLDPAVAWSGALGAALVLAYAGSGARAALRAARDVASEVDRQLRRFPREHGSALIPHDFSPSYKACVDIVSRLPLGRGGLTALGALAVPGALALTLLLLYSGAENKRAIEGLMAFVLFSGLVGFAAALSLDVARATLTSVCRSARAQAGADPLPASASDGAADVLGHAAGPAAQALVVGAAALALAVAPFLH
jgi:Na+/H+-translocating membrane pyrophosphatase